MVVVILGYMGSGKTTVGKQLAERLEVSFIDLDDAIESEAKATISEIFAQKGAIYFRTLEAKVLRKLVATGNRLVLSLGGGTPSYANNMTFLKDHKDVASFYLNLNVLALAQRLQKEKAHRPLIKDIPEAELPEFIGKHLFERNPFYQQADFVLDVHKKTVGEVVTMIAEKLDKEN